MEIKNSLGLHARPAGQLVQLLNRFKSQVFIEKDEQRVDGKSIMSVMMLAAEQGTAITVEAQGEDAEAVIEEVEKLIDSGFGED